MVFAEAVADSAAVDAAEDSAGAVVDSAAEEAAGSAPQAVGMRLPAGVGSGPRAGVRLAFRAPAPAVEFLQADSSGRQSNRG